MRAENYAEPAICRQFELKDGAATAYIVVDSVLGGGGTGGVRMGPDVTVDEVAALAREMSLKFAWLNIPRGGAKSGICLHDTAPGVRDEVLREFGRSIRDLVASGRYVPGMDLGVGQDEYQTIMRGAGFAAEETDPDPDIDSNYYTAMTVFLAAKAALAQKGRSLEGTSVLIEGLGKVGRHLARLFDGDGARIVGVSTLEGAVVERAGLDVGELLSLAEDHGDDCVHRVPGKVPMPARELYRAAGDLLVPGARVHSIGPAEVAALKVRMIVSLANAAAMPDAEDAMQARGIVYIPGFVANSGGIFCWYLARYDRETRDSLLERGFSRKVRTLVAEAEGAGRSVAALAREQADHKAARLHAELDGGPWQRLAGIMRKSAPDRLSYVLMRRLLGAGWGRRDTRYLRWYVDAKYFS